ncbi:MAG: site-specific integrase, partial [Streptosporangiaceae bacterium]
MRDSGERAEPPSPLPPAMAAALAAFERHLRSERSLSPHTVRAYAGDIRSLLGHASRQGVAAPEGLGLAELRSWLAIQHESGAARTTLARRGAAARTFTAFAHRRGWLAADPGPRLGTLKARRALPHVLREDEMAAVLAGLDKAGRAAAAAEAPSYPADAPSYPADVPSHPADAGRRTEAAVVLRDAAVLELFYATGIRVSELCGLDSGHLDHGRRTVRVRGKGDKERTVPVGVPALRAVTRWLAAGRPALA